jgi:predicted branched-subunit amino acid permease
MAFFPQRFPQHTIAKPDGKLGYFTGLAMPNWCAWQLGSLIRILLASQIPRDWGIGFAGTLVLLGLTIPLIVNRATLAGVIVASAVAVAAAGLPYRLGLVAAILAGIAASVTIDRMTGSATDQEQGIP